MYYIVNTKENTDWRISREHRKAWRRKAEQRCPHVATCPCTMRSRNSALFPEAPISAVTSYVVNYLMTFLSAIPSITVS